MSVVGPGSLVYLAAQRLRPLRVYRSPQPSPGGTSFTGRSTCHFLLRRERVDGGKDTNKVLRVDEGGDPQVGVVVLEGEEVQGGVGVQTGEAPRVDVACLVPLLVGDVGERAVVSRDHHPLDPGVRTGVDNDLGLSPFSRSTPRPSPPVPRCPENTPYSGPDGRHSNPTFRFSGRGFRGRGKFKEVVLLRSPPGCRGFRLSPASPPPPEYLLYLRYDRASTRTRTWGFSGPQGQVIPGQSPPEVKDKSNKENHLQGGNYWSKPYITTPNSTLRTPNVGGSIGHLQDFGS